MPIISAVDIGSNAFRLAIGFVDQSGSLSLVEDFREAVRLGREAFSPRQTLSEDTILRSIEALKRLKKISDDHNVEKTRVIATSALREARNSKELITRVKEQVGWNIEVIGGEEEANLIFTAVKSKVDLKGKTALLVDIGGGSVEITLSQNAEILRSNSYPFGSVRLLETLKEEKLDSKTARKLLEKHINFIGVELERELKNHYVDCLIGTGGTIETIGHLRVEVLKKKRSSLIKRVELETFLKQLRSLSYEERINKLGLKPDRADVIEPACMVYERVFKHTSESELLIPHVGLKEGVLLDMLSKSKPGKNTNGNLRHELLTFAKEIGRKYQYNEKHAERVSKLSSELFELTRDLHKLDDKDRLLLEVASLLHDIGQFIGFKGHHKHSYYILKSEPFVGLDKEHKEIVSLLARYHRKSHPAETHPEFMSLTPKDRERVRQLASILRISDALDREHVGHVRSLRARVRNGSFVLNLKGKGDMVLEHWAVREKSKLFEDVFKLKVEIEE